MKSPSTKKSDEDNPEQESEVIGLLTIEEKEYAAVAFIEGTEEEMDVFIFQVVEGDDLAESKRMKNSNSICNIS